MRAAPICHPERSATESKDLSVLRRRIPVICRKDSSRGIPALPLFLVARNDVSVFCVILSEAQRSRRIFWCYGRISGIGWEDSSRRIVALPLFLVARNDVWGGAKNIKETVLLSWFLLNFILFISWLTGTMKSCILV